MNAGLGRFGGKLAHQIVGGTEGDVLADQLIGQIGGQERGVTCCLRCGLLIDHERGHHLGSHRKSHAGRIHGIKDGLLVFLKVPVVGHGKSFENRQKTEEVPVESTCFSTGQFGDVGILLLRHQTGACGVSVAQAGKSKFRGGPEDHILGET